MRIAILENQPDQAALLESTLVGEGHDCAVFLAGQPLIDATGRENFDLFVLDWEVPDVSGPEVLRWVRSHVSATVPVLFVTSRNSAEDIVATLDLGADDYMTKPFTRAVLGARTRAAAARLPAAACGRGGGQAVPARIENQHRLCGRQGDSHHPARV